MKCGCVRQWVGREGGGCFTDAGWMFVFSYIVWVSSRWVSWCDVVIFVTGVYCVHKSL